MSVPVNKRSHGELEVNVMARDLCAYTLRITANQKNFPTEQKSFTEKIRDAAIAWRNHASKGNSYKLLCRMDEYYRQLWEDDKDAYSTQKHGTT